MMEIRTVFKVDDVVYFFADSKLVKGKISHIEINVSKNKTEIEYNFLGNYNKREIDCYKKVDSLFENALELAEEEFSIPF